MSADARFPVDAYSPDQISELLTELHAYTSKLRDTAVRAKVAKRKTEEDTPEVPEALAGLLRSSGVSQDNVAGLEALHKSLQAALKNAPVMHMTLAAMPSRTLKRQLTVWFRAQIHPHALLTFAARSDIGGGFMLQAGSHFYDHSLRNLILANKSRLTEIAGV